MIQAAECQVHHLMGNVTQSTVTSIKADADGIVILPQGLLPAHLFPLLLPLHP